MNIGAPTTTHRYSMTHVPRVPVVILGWKAEVSGIMLESLRHIPKTANTRDECRNECEKRRYCQFAITGPVEHWLKSFVLASSVACQPISGTDRTTKAVITKDKQSALVGMSGTVDFTIHQGITYHAHDKLQDIVGVPSTKTCVDFCRIYPECNVAVYTVFVTLINRCSLTHVTDFKPSVANKHITSFVAFID
jgi:hypothetical protein